MKDVQATREPQLQPSIEKVQHFKTGNVFIVFFFVGLFALLDPDPDPDDLNQYGSIRIRIWIHNPARK
jgi:hypothetical protein